MPEFRKTRNGDGSSVSGQPWSTEARIEVIVAYLKSQHVGSAPVQFSPDQVRKALQQAARSGGVGLSWPHPKGKPYVPNCHCGNYPECH